MTEYFTPVDIANRALQHCGASMIDATKGFSENSKNAQQTSFCYGKLRRAELRRNVWRFATRRAMIRAIDQNTMLLVPSLWSSGTTYFVGSIVSDQQNNAWISRVPNNRGNDPQNSLVWEPYFGPLSVPLFDPTQAYFAGELAYTTPGDGTNRVYLSLQGSNSDVPGTATAWDAVTTFFKNQVVTFNNVAYMSLIDLNTNNEPDLAAPLFNIATTYAAAAKVGGSDGIIYQSIAGGNVGNDPTLDNGVHWTNTGILNPWTTVFVGGIGSDKWLQIGGAEFPMGVGLATLNIVYPLSIGAADSRNVFRLPSGYLREASQYPNQTTTPLGGPSGVTYGDWTFEGDFLVTADTGPIPFRFVADVTDVRAMDDMFSEGLAARIALEVCEPLTQSTAKLGSIAKIYQEWIDQARTVNGIETGWEEPPDDDYLTVRY